MSESNPNNHQPEIPAEQTNGGAVPEVYAELAPDRIAEDSLEIQKWEKFASGRTLPEPKRPWEQPEQTRHDLDKRMFMDPLNPYLQDQNVNQLNPDAQAKQENIPNISMHNQYGVAQYIGRTLMEKLK